MLGDTGTHRLTLGTSRFVTKLVEKSLKTVLFIKTEEPLWHVCAATTRTLTALTYTKTVASSSVPLACSAEWLLTVPTRLASLPITSSATT